MRRANLMSVLARRPEQWRDLHPGVRWPGEVAELVRLLDSVGRHCTCHASRACAAHQLLDAQHSLNHLVYARGARQHFIDAEWNVDGLPYEALTPHRAAPATRARRKLASQVAFVAGALVLLAVLLSLGGAWLAVVGS